MKLLVQRLFISLMGIMLTAETLQLDNPIGSNNQTLLDFIIGVTSFLLGGTAVFAVVMIIYGGLLMLTSAGRQEQVEKARDTILWAVIGLAIILFSGVIVRFLFADFTNVQLIKT